MPTTTPSHRGRRNHNSWGLWQHKILCRERHCIDQAEGSSHIGSYCKRLLLNLNSITNWIFFFCIQDSLQASVSPVCLPTKSPFCIPNPETFTNNSMKVAGWGRVDNESNGLSDRNFFNIGAASACLNQLNVPVRQASFCRDTNSKYNLSSHLCAGGVKGIC